MFLFKKKKYDLQSFTYFIPAPPARSTGYREKQFDRLFSEFMKLGFDLIDLKTQALTNGAQSGLWVLCIIRPLTETASKYDWNSFQNKIEKESQLSTKENHEIEGFYMIHDQTAENEI